MTIDDLREPRQVAREHERVEYEVVRDHSVEDRYAFASAPLTRSGVNGTSRSRAPVASNTAFPIAAGIAHGAGSPAANVGWSGRSIRSTSTLGTWS